MLTTPRTRCLKKPSKHKSSSKVRATSDCSPSGEDDNDDDPASPMMDGPPKARGSRPPIPAGLDAHEDEDYDQNVDSAPNVDSVDIDISPSSNVGNGSGSTGYDMSQGPSTSNNGATGARNGVVTNQPGPSVGPPTGTSTQSVVSNQPTSTHGAPSVGMLSTQVKVDSKHLLVKEGLPHHPTL